MFFWDGFIDMLSGGYFFMFGVLSGDFKGI